jgi:hypothetical protein
MELNKENFCNLFKNYTDNKITRIIIAPIYFQKVNMGQIDIYNDKLEGLSNIIKIIKENKDYKEYNFIRTVYYSQKKDNKTIYTEEYDFIKNFEYKDITLCIAGYSQIIQDIISFPNLNIYDYTEQINQKIYDCNNFKIIIENKKIFIEFDKYDYEIINNVYNLFK